MVYNTLSKDVILKYLYLIEAFKQKDNTMIELKQRMDKLTQQNMELYAQFQRDPNNSEIQQGLNATNDEYTKLKKEKEEHIKSTFSVFSEKCPPSIMNMVLEDAVNFDLLEHVLTQTEKYNSGTISYNEGLNNGLDFIRKISNLPDDFFVKQ